MMLAEEMMEADDLLYSRNARPWTLLVRARTLGNCQADPGKQNVLGSSSKAVKLKHQNSSSIVAHRSFQPTKPT